VIIFFRENFKIMLEVAGGPEMGMMMSGMGTETIMRFVTGGYKRYIANKDRLVQGA
jgi:hypothetical protein